MLPLPDPYYLRPMAVADIPAVMVIDRLSFPTPTQEQMFLNELVENQLAHYQVLARRDEPDAIIIGFAGFWLIAGEIHVSTIAVDPAEHGAQRLVPLHNRIERKLQRDLVDRAVQRHGRRDVVERIARGELLKEPHPLLRK